MGSYTTRYGFYLMGGGSSGTITPDEAVDVDKINDSLRKIDSALGVTAVPDANLPATPGIGQLFKATTTDGVVYWDGSNYQNFFPSYLQKNQLAGTYYSKTDFSNGALDSRYFTQSNLLNDGKLDSRYVRKTQLVGGTASVSATSADSDGSHTGYSGTKVVTVSGMTNISSVTLTPQRASSFEIHWGVASVNGNQFTIYYWSSNSSSNITFHWQATGS